MSQLTPEIPFMASLWIRSGYDMKVEMSAETYQVGAHFKALIKAILVAALKSFERFFRISSSPTGLCNCHRRRQRYSIWTGHLKNTHGAWVHTIAIVVL